MIVGCLSLQPLRQFGHPFVEFELAPRAPGPLAIKHGFDVLAAALLILLLSPLLLLTALAILLTMGRPILFIQERAGRRGRCFRMLKFRTMPAQAETITGPVWSRGRLAVRRSAAASPTRRRGRPGTQARTRPTGNAGAPPQ